MIGHVVAGDELHRFARAGDEEVAGNAQVFDDAVKRMFRFVDVVGKEFLHRAGAVFERRQGNVVDDCESDGFACRTWFAVGRKGLPRTRPAAVVPSVHDACPYCL